MIKYVRLAFIEKDVEHVDRIYYAWLLTFICRLWLTWINKTSKDELDGIQSQIFNSGLLKTRRKSKRQFFISNPAYFVSLQTYHLFRVELMIDISFSYKVVPEKNVYFSRCRFYSMEEINRLS
jgi:hypothetical protein